MRTECSTLPTCGHRDRQNFCCAIKSMINLGNHPDDGLPVYAIRSPFGPYIQCGNASDANKTPRGCWLPAGLDITDEIVVRLNAAYKSGR